MKLTPRPVAKLLTQSYQGAVLDPPDYLKNNPAGLTVDPEFLALNPEYKGFANSTTPSAGRPLVSGRCSRWSARPQPPDTAYPPRSCATPPGAVRCSHPREPAGR